MKLDSDGIIFVHFPKTGGTSIAMSMLKRNGIEVTDQYRLLSGATQSDYSIGPDERHLPASHWADSAYDSYYKFSIIRHPFDLVVSKYNYIHKVYNEALAETPSDSETLDHIIQHGTMKQFVTGVDDVYCFDQLSRVFDSALDFSLEHLHMKQANDSSDQITSLTPELKAFALEHFAEDFVHFGFDSDQISVPTKNCTRL